MRNGSAAWLFTYYTIIVVTALTLIGIQLELHDSLLFGKTTVQFNSTADQAKYIYRNVQPSCWKKYLELPDNRVLHQEEVNTQYEITVQLVQNLIAEFNSSRFIESYDNTTQEYRELLEVCG